jgi:hypothetical protein
MFVNPTSIAAYEHIADLHRTAERHRQAHLVVAARKHAAVGDRGAAQASFAARSRSRLAGALTWARA